MAGRLNPNNGTASLTPRQANYQTIKSLTQKTQAQFERMLGSTEKASQFGASVISAVSTNPALQDCNPGMVMQCALIAASLNLDVNSNLGMSAIIPFKDKSGQQIPQFQIMVRGWIQLAMRSCEYTALDCVEVYEDEFESFDPFKNKLNYHLVSNGQRDNGKTDKIVGYYSYFELTNGAKHCLYWTKKQIQEHGKKFSKSYTSQYSPWQTNFDAMAKKTLIKQLLSKWGMLSTIMSKAIRVDQMTNAVVDENDNLLTVEYADIPENEAIETKHEEVITAAEDTTAEPETLFSEEKDAPTTGEVEEERL